MSVKVNLNDIVKFKLTDHGQNIYYHHLDGFNEEMKQRGLKGIEPRFLPVDEDGYSHMQLWSFIEVFGEHIGLLKPNIIDSLELVFEGGGTDG